MKKKHFTEEEILKEFRNEKKVDKLVREYSNLVCLIVRKTLELHRIKFTREDVEDLHNEVFLQLFANDFRRLRQYDEKKELSFSGWIKLVATHTTVNQIRKNGMLDMAKRIFQIPFEDIEDILKYEDENRLEARENIEILTKAMGNLSEHDKYLLKKYYFEWLSLQEIAKSLGTGYHHAAKMIHDAKKRLKKETRKITKGEI